MAVGEDNLCAVSRLGPIARTMQFVYVMVVMLAEGRFDVMMPAPNRQVNPSFYYPYRSELPAIWSDISSAIQGFKDHSPTRVVLDEEAGPRFFQFCPVIEIEARSG